MRRMTSNRSLLWRTGAVLVSLGLTACSNGNGDHTAGAAQSAITVAQPAPVVSADSFQQLFTEPADVRDARADVPVSVYMVRLDQLRAYNGRQDPAGLLVDLETAFFPVRVRGDVRSSLELHKEAGQWQTHSYGASEHARILDRVRQTAADSARVAPSELFEVRVLALNMYFLGRRTADGLVLVPMLDDADHGFKAGESRPAAEVLAKLRLLALAHDGQPT